MSAARAAALAFALAAAAPAHADAELVGALNAARGRGCDGNPGLARPFAENARLAAAAKLLSQRVQPGDAMQRAGYRATRWALVSLGGTSSASGIAGHVAKSFCKHLLEPGFAEVGIHRQMDQTWIVLAAPFAPPPAEAVPAVRQRVLELVNAARGQARDCGGKPFAAAGPLRANATLDRAADAHSHDMAGKGFFSHDGSDGSTVLVRSTRVGYAGRAVGENIASGQTTPEAAVEGWIKSPPHCANLMNPVFTEMGLAYVVNPASPMGIYWTQVFGTPR